MCTQFVPLSTLVISHLAESHIKTCVNSQIFFFDILLQSEAVKQDKDILLLPSPNVPARFRFVYIYVFFHQALIWK